jgi:hypothetical protein
MFRPCLGEVGENLNHLCLVWMSTYFRIRAVTGETRLVVPYHST